MAQTQGTIASTWAGLADNTNNQISPEDLRNAFETWRPRHGQIYQVGNASETAIANTTTYCAATLSGTTLSTGAYGFDSPSSGQLRYTGANDVMLHFVITVSLTVATNNQLIHFRVAKNGTTDEASECRRFVATGTDVGAVAVHVMASASQNDYLELAVRNQTSAANVTITTINIQAVSIPV